MIVVILLTARHNHPLLGDARINRPPSSRLPDPLSLVTNPRSQTSIARLLVERMGIWGVSWRAVVQEVLTKNNTQKSLTCARLFRRLLQATVGYGCHGATPPPIWIQSGSSLDPDEPSLIQPSSGALAFIVYHLAPRYCTEFLSCSISDSFLFSLCLSSCK